MEVNFDSAEPNGDLISVPAGTYLCSIAEVRERETRAGDPLWGLRLVVAEGEYAGRTAAWDNLAFSPRGLNRVKLVFSALDLPSNGEVEIGPDDLVTRQALVEVRAAEYFAADGSAIRRNEVPYEGYRRLEEGARPAPTAKATASEELPF